MSDSLNSRTTWLFVKVTVFTLLVPGSVVGLVPYLLLEDPSLAAVDLLGFGFLGVLPVVLGFALYLRCAYGFILTGRGTPAPIDPPTQLVTDGPYRYCRNPMYISIMSIIAGEALLYRDAALLYFLLALFAGFHAFVIGYEERALNRRFSETYVRYCEAVPRWVSNWAELKTLYRLSFLKVGAFVLTAGVVAHVIHITIGLPLTQMPVSLHAVLVVLPSYAVFGCIIYARQIELDGVLRKITFALVTGLLVTTVVMHLYSILAQDSEWYGIFPMWYSVMAIFIYAGFALFLKNRRFIGQ